MKRGEIQTMVLYALFIALTFVLGLTPIGIIPIGVMNVTILCIPVIIGTIFLGLKAGLLFGACFGLASTMRAYNIPPIGQSAIIAPLFAAEPMGIGNLYVILVSIIPRLLVPITTHFTYRLTLLIIEKISKKEKPEQSRVAVIPAAVIGSLTNTVFYLGLLLLFYSLADNTAASQSAEIVTVIDPMEIVNKIITGLGAGVGIVEAVVAGIIVPPVCIAVDKACLHIGTQKPKPEGK